MTESGTVCTACGATYRDAVTTCPNCQLPIDSGLPRVGEIFDSKYEIVELLGAGGMGEVFKARHVHLGSLRALKVMRRNLVADESSRRRFSREARLATRVHHRNVAIVYDFAVAANGSYYIVSELVEGMTLRQWSTSPELFSEKAALDIAIQTLRGLEHLHRGGIMHRDVSSDNVMITTDAEGNAVAKIIDLGLAKLLTDSPTGEGATTRAGLFLGNPRYSSPEQLGALPDGEEIDARSDVYSFGVVLYELLTGAPPFASSTPQGYAAKHLMEHPPALTPRTGNRALSDELQAVVWKALEKNRENRYRSAQELAEALGALASPPAGPAASRAAVLVPEPPPVPIPAPEPTPLPPPLPAPEPTPPPGTAARDAAGPAGEDASAPIDAPPARLSTGPPAHVRERWPLPYVLAGLAIAAVLVAIVAFWRSDPAPETAPPEPVATQTTPPPPPTSTAPLVVTGDLVINAVPWGRIVSVNDGAKEWVSGPAMYTPQTLKVPPGNYTVALLGPDGTQQSVVVGLTSAEPAYVRIEFHPSEEGSTAKSNP